MNILNGQKKVGYYGISRKSNMKNYTHELQIYFAKKPNKLQIFCCRILIGWDWIDL